MNSSIIQGGMGMSRSEDISFALCESLEMGLIGGFGSKGILLEGGLE